MSSSHGEWATRIRSGSFSSPATASSSSRFTPVLTGCSSGRHASRNRRWTWRGKRRKRPADERRPVESYRWEDARESYEARVEEKGAGTTDEGPGSRLLQSQALRRRTDAEI